MAINLQIYSNAYNTTKSVAVDFISEIITTSDQSASNDTRKFFFKFTTSARDTSNVAFTPRILENFTDLALNKTVQSYANTTSAYTNVKSMVIDYVYDYINGHTANQYLSGCTAKAAMKFN